MYSEEMHLTGFTLQSYVVPILSSTCEIAWAHLWRVNVHAGQLSSRNDLDLPEMVSYQDYVLNVDVLTK
ncbi:hypothetical protein BPAE_0012g00690 [Botrytis paeoniae]|uniref:Uncharacterized protein n=1 Tax=Botrytis paeoniae TaxID=278948 RepID=A0A4Z1FXZ0_9HELO|nr:hypothetical protein BPAE_0012g00690 [Botrytis paeoniae]